MPNQRKLPIKFEGEAVEPEPGKKQEAPPPPRPPQPDSESGGENTADENIGGVQRPPADS